MSNDVPAARIEKAIGKLDERWMQDDVHAVGTESLAGTSAWPKPNLGQSGLDPVWYAAQ